MPAWLTEAVSTHAPLEWKTVLAQLLAALLAGGVIAFSYRFSQRRPAHETFPFFVTIVLLTVLVTMTTLVIDTSVARAFSLVGALAIVRFRTIVEDTRDTTFVIFAVVAGMAIGAHNMMVCVIGVPIVALTGVILNRLGGAAAVATVERRLEVRVGAGIDPEALLEPVLARRLAMRRFVGATTARQGSALDVAYAVRLANGEKPLDLVRELARLEGVQNVNLGDPTAETR